MLDGRFLLMAINVGHGCVLIGTGSLSCSPSSDSFIGWLFSPGCCLGSCFFCHFLLVTKSSFSILLLFAPLALVQ